MPTPLLDNRQLGADTARANLLTNGGFEIWQRGNGPFTTNAAFTADRWMMQIAGAGSLSVSRDTANADGANGSCAAVTYSAGAGDSVPGLLQTISANDSLLSQLRGRTVSGSIRVRTNVAGVRPWLQVNGARSYGTAHSGNGSYQTLIVTGTFTASEGTTYFGVEFTPGTGGTAYLDNAMLVVGAVPADYAPLHPADDLARCLRYYERVPSDGGMHLRIMSIATAAGQAADGTIYWKVRKAVDPTVTLVGAWGGANASAPVITGLGAKLDCVVLEITSSAAGLFFSSPNNGSYVQAEANP